MADVLTLSWLSFLFTLKGGIRKQPLSFSDKGDIDTILFKELEMTNTVLAEIKDG